MTPEQKLRSYCERWGGQLLRVPFKTYIGFCKRRSEGFFDCPATQLAEHAGVWWKEKTIVVSGRVRWGSIVHEMGHVFACRLPPDDNTCNEISFLGWEYALAQKVGCLSTWLKHNDDYFIDWERNDEEFFSQIGDLDTPKARKEFFESCLQEAVDARLVENGEPRAIR